MANEHNGDYGQQWLTDHTAGSGPYRVKRVEPNSLYELEAWDGYWKGWPQPEKRAWAASSTASSPRTPAAARARAAIDIAGSLSPEDLDQLESVRA